MHKCELYTAVSSERKPSRLSSQIRLQEAEKENIFRMGVLNYTLNHLLRRG